MKTPPGGILRRSSVTGIVAFSKASDEIAMALLGQPKDKKSNHEGKLRLIEQFVSEMSTVKRHIENYKIFSHRTISNTSQQQILPIIARTSGDNRLNFKITVEGCQIYSK